MGHAEEDQTCAVKMFVCHFPSLSEHRRCIGLSICSHCVVNMRTVLHKVNAIIAIFLRHDQEQISSQKSLLFF